MGHIEEELDKKYREDYEAKLKIQEKSILEKASKDSNEKTSELQTQLFELETKLSKAQEAETDLRKKQRQLETDHKEFELKKERELDAAKKELYEKAKADSISEYNLKLQAKEDELKRISGKLDKANEREIDLIKRENELVEHENNIAMNVEEIVKQKTIEIEKKIKTELKKESSLELTDLQSQVSELQNKLTDSQHQELELRKKQRELESDKKEFEIQKQRELDFARAEIFQKAKTQSDVEFQMKLREKDEQLKQMTTKIDELKKKAEQGSPQQLQGESQELELEELLKSQFPFDSIAPSPKGVKGADLIQIVKNNFSQECGTIIWGIQTD